MWFECLEFRWRRLTNDEDVVRLFGGDVNANTRQWRHDAPDIVGTDEHDARIVLPNQSFDVVRDLFFRWKLSNAFILERYIRS